MYDKDILLYILFNYNNVIDKNNIKDEKVVRFKIYV